MTFDTPTDYRLMKKKTISTLPVYLFYYFTSTTNFTSLSFYCVLISPLPSQSPAGVTYSAKAIQLFLCHQFYVTFIIFFTNPPPPPPQGVTYPAIHAIWSKWAPHQERTKLVTFGFSGSYFGTVVALTVSGYLAESSAQWQSIFYLFGEFLVRRK